MNTPMPVKFTYPGPGIGYSYHNHSNWSDGASSMEEMCRAAKKAGLKEFGLSDHFVIHPDKNEMPVDWALDNQKINDYISSLQQLKCELDDEHFTLRIGLEVDFFQENPDEIFAELEKYPLDYLIGSVHYVGTFPVDHSAPPWERLSSGEQAEICGKYWEKVLDAARCGRFLFLGHLDLPKKFDLIPDMDKKYYDKAVAVLAAAAETGTAIELNTSGWYKPCQEEYPSPAILMAAREKKVPVVVNPDAHDAAHVDRGFDRALALLQELGIY